MMVFYKKLNVHYEFILFFKFIQKFVLKFVATWTIKKNKMSMLNMALHF